MPDENPFFKLVNDAGKAIGDTASSVVDTVGGAASVVGKGVSKTVDNIGSAVQSIVPGGEKSAISESQMEELLSFCYGKALDGIPNVSRPLDKMVNDYMSKHESIDSAAHAMVNAQLLKNATSGFLSGVAGIFTLPVAIAAIPANISNVLYVQLRMVAALAQMGGYDTRSDQVQTMVYVCLTGSAAGGLFKDAGIKFAGKLAKGAIQRIPGKVLTKINQAVGFRLVTKFGQTGIVNLGKLIPVVGGIVGGGFDFATTQTIANVAYKAFIGETDSEVIDDETIEIIEEEEKFEFGHEFED